jgi:hypothetical protein
MKKGLLAGLALVVIAVGTILVVKKVSPVGWGWWGEYNAASGIAIKGYDPVAYFLDDAAVQGSPENSYAWNGVTWQFVSAANRDLFADDPQRYAPQFGGFCAFAVSKGFTADIDPDAWFTKDGNLYLFADRGARDDWVAALDEGSLDHSVANWAKR